MLATAAAGALLAVLMSVGSLWAIAILLLLTLVSAHVMGNSLGTRLRDGVEQRPLSAQGPGRLPLRFVERAPTRLRERARLHWITLVVSGCGAAVGAYFGGSALASSYPAASTAAIVVGYASSGVLGGFAGFVVSSFLAVLRQALSEAHAGSDKHRPVRRRGD